jgi:hypothetical protein
VASTDEIPRTMVIINNKSTGELLTFMPEQKVANVFQRPSGSKSADCPATVTEVTAYFSGMHLRPNDPAWSAPVALGEKSIEGVHVVGTQRVYTLPVGRLGNSKPVTVTVEQWSSPELGVIVDKTTTASTGAQVHYQLTQIAQTEPDPALFKMPADYRKNVVAAGGTLTATAITTRQ